MSERGLDIVILGLSISSSWGNGHATTYRSLVRGLCELGHRVLFLERDQPWYADHRDLHEADYVRVGLYQSVSDLKQRYTREVRQADLVIVGSYVPDGVEVGTWVTRTALGVSAFYDIDTPITLAMLEQGGESYLSRALLPRYALYLSFTGGRALELIEQSFGSPRARALYCAVDAALYYPEPQPLRWDLGYMGTYSDDRQPGLDRLLLSAAQRLPGHNFAVAGPQYPEHIRWPANVLRVNHLPPADHRAFYNQQRFTLNLTRAHMRALGHSPSVRLFEAAACGTPIISDSWSGLETLFEPGREILIAEDSDDTLRYLTEISEVERKALGERARERIMRSHTGKHRAEQLLQYLREVRSGSEQHAVAEV
jgi:spore maturation protein CgeB